MTLGCGRIAFEPRDLPTDGIQDGADDVRPITSNLAFVTSTSRPPSSLGGLAGADAFCMDRAAAAGLPGTYVAWLSSATTNARDRLAGARGWQRPDGRLVVDTVADLLAGRIFHPIEIDELGNRIAPRHVMTNTFADGLSAGFDCAGFTSNSGAEWGGQSNATTAFWTSTGGSQGCGVPQHLYCFGISSSTAVTPPPITTRRAFQPATSWKSGGGLVDADATCQQAADAASLGGTFRALLATSTATAISRFDLGGSNWVRLDGIELASSTAKLASGDTVAPLNVSERGVYLLPNGRVWTGAVTPSVVGDAACVDWTGAQPTVMGRSGSPVSVGPSAFDGVFEACNVMSMWLYCLEL